MKFIAATIPVTFKLGIVIMNKRTSWNSPSKVKKKGVFFICGFECRRGSMLRQDYDDAV